ncbi:MAG: glycine--tRNA ligase subunit alpha [Armatimonadetes bacterium]|nr:glycine--tRNA ligase subunit alpha [Armatimonadota bacterium]NOG92222.1 glycine--tRNA ligase subunit alpha [Armatimonadota bacterium]
MNVQEILSILNSYWADQGCVILQPYDVEVGAGTMHPDTVFRSLGPEPWNCAYVQPSRRPADGRYTRNPMRNQRYFQYQVLMKPSPDNIVDLYMGSLNAIGFNVKRNDVRLVEDDWESPSMGASGVGWEVWLNGAEITQFTFFQQMGGIELNPVSAEITYGPERLCLMLNNGYSFWEDLEWGSGVSYRDVNYDLELQHNLYNFEVADTALLFELFDKYEAESRRVVETDAVWDEELGRYTTEFEKSDGGHKVPLVYPAFDLALRCSHVFNLLDARGALSPTERAAYINRIRARARACCLKYLEGKQAFVKQDS